MTNIKLSVPYFLYLCVETNPEFDCLILVVLKIDSLYIKY